MLKVLNYTVRLNAPEEQCMYVCVISARSSWNINETVNLLKASLHTLSLCVCVCVWQSRDLLWFQMLKC